MHTPTNGSYAPVWRSHEGERGVTCGCCCTYSPRPWLRGGGGARIPPRRRGGKRSFVGRWRVAFARCVNLARLHPEKRWLCGVVARLTRPQRCVPYTIGSMPCSYTAPRTTHHTILHTPHRAHYTAHRTPTPKPPHASHHTPRITNHTAHHTSTPHTRPHL